MNETYSGRCLTCKNWRGDKDATWQMIANSPVCMDLRHGFAPYGDCGVQSKWAALDVRGDVYVTLEVPAYFGCPYWATYEVAQ